MQRPETPITRSTYLDEALAPSAKFTPLVLTPEPV